MSVRVICEIGSIITIHSSILRRRVVGSGWHVIRALKKLMWFPEHVECEHVECGDCHTWISCPRDILEGLWNAYQWESKGGHCRCL